MSRFTTAIEAQKIADDLHKQIRTINYNPDLKKVAKNLNNMITELSSAEVLARRHNNPKFIETPQANLEKAIDYIEKMLLILRLSQ